VTTPVFSCIFNSFICLLAASNKSKSYLALFYSLIFALFLILFALYPNLKVLNVYLSLYEHIEQQMIKVVLLLPPKDYCKILVNFESLYGTCYFFYEVNALITFPKALKDLLIFLAYYNCCPTTPVFPTF